MICACGGRYFTHKRTEHDEDGTKMRLRTCRNCGTEVAVEIEERPITVAAFWGRAESHNERQRQRNMLTSRHKYRQLTCRHCGHTFTPRRYKKHINTPEHLTALKHRPTEASRARGRRSMQRDYWRKRGIDPDVAQELNNSMRLEDRREP